ncbi:uncharacterized protein [Hetaerina americana]|uniref:uncharacterized protein n=1 Tax=Hetaerina americana TaxID=62018 RepID=UPI003A7F1257
MAQVRTPGVLRPSTPMSLIRGASGMGVGSRPSAALGSREEALIGGGPGSSGPVAVRSALVDVSTQVDLPQGSGGGGGGLFSCGGDEGGEDGGRRRGIPLGKGSRKSEVPVYSKEDIREQYCITQRQLNVLDRGQRGLFGGGGPAGGPFGGSGGGGGGLFGCLSNYQVRCEDVPHNG